MTQANLASSTSVVNNNRSNNHSSSKNRECSKCRYALFPATGRCTNFECSRYRRQSGAMTSDQLLKEYEPPALFHGRHWGDWILDVERLCLVYHAFPVALGNGSGRTEGVPPYTAFWGDYEIDLERVRDSAAMLDWIFQIRGKSWATSRVMRDLIEAFDDLFKPQANLCSNGCNKVIQNPKAFLKRRIATVGKPDRPLKDAA